MSTDNVCPICLESLKVKDNYKISCGHEFHTECIMNWFRFSNGSCPCCKDNPNGNIKHNLPIYYGYWNIQFIEKRCNVIKKHNKKEKNKKLINQFEKIDLYKNELTELRKLQKEYLNQQSIKDVKFKIKEFNTKIRNKDSQIKKIKVNIVSKYPIIQI
jgi:hypothetical protein|tara:strand:- start:304 stop:777 length:474 start_codon:yes stop_codon:yes gene_type:complete